MPIGIGIAVGVAAIGGVAAGKKLGGGSRDGQAAGVNSPTQSFTDAATSKQPSTVQGASNASQQAQVAATKQRKKAAAGDTLLTPIPPAGGYKSGSASLSQKTLIGS